MRGGVIALLLHAYASPALADEEAERRLLTGLKLFPTLVAADQDLGRKRGDDGRLRLVLLYRENGEVARDAARRLMTASRVKGFPVRAMALPYSRLDELRDDPPAAIFLAEWSPDDLSHVADFGLDHHRLVFSPFKGDVSAGAQTGIFVSDRILPLINVDALKAARIRLRPFLMEVAKTHE